MEKEMHAAGKTIHSFVNSNEMRKILPFLGLIAVVAVFAVITGGQAVSAGNIKTVLLQSCIYMVAAMGVTFTISQGNMDMSLGGIIVASCMAGGILGEHSAWLVLPACILVSIAGQLIVALTHIYLNIPTVIGSFIVMYLAKGIASTVMLTRSTNITLPDGLKGLSGNWFFYLTAVVVIVISYILSEYTKLGKINRAVGANQEAVRASGVKVNKYKILAFLFSGVTLGIASLLMLIRSVGVTAKTGTGFETNIVIILTLGGISLNGGSNVRVFKAVIGCLLFTFLDNALIMVGVNSTEVGLIKGVIFLIAVAIGFDRKSMTTIV